ncbi:MAG TPA: FxsA family protein [Casimicrobiaceae bacterium]|nr:FxsA family protein [Casimicrobiaceae bacterium]
MRFVMLAIVLIFPLVDLVVTARFARWTGVPMWMWLTGSALAGMWVLANERVQFRSRALAAFRRDSLMRGLLDSGRRVLAGLLLIAPGVLSDVLALLLLLLPINQRGAFGDAQPVTAGRPPYRGHRTLDGDYRRLD